MGTSAAWFYEGQLRLHRQCKSTTKVSKDNVTVALEIEFKTAPPGCGIILPVPISTRVFVQACDHTKFQLNGTQAGEGPQCSIDYA